MNTLYYGDNLKILQKYVQDQSVDLIYLDPPFNSKRAYNVIFKDKAGKDASAQIHAFEDTWQWTRETQESFDEIMTGDYPVALKEVVKAFKGFLGINNLMAYLTMMAIRLMEMHRVLKDTGSLYLHCDPTASHYLKILLDQIFGVECFRNELPWQRTNAHNIASKYFSTVHDVILFYTKTSKYLWNTLYTEYSEEQRSRYKRDERGRLFKAENLTMATASKDRNFEWRGSKPPPNRGWGMSFEKLEELWKTGRILTKKDGTPRLDGLKVYFDQMPGKPVIDLWNDIKRVGNTSKERLGYPTQKPLALLERIIQASSNEGDVVMDPFCGCGTAVVAAEKLGRKWIGIDITHLAISLIKKRLHDHFPDVQFDTVGEPESVAAAKELADQSKFQFEAWAVSLLGGQPYKSKGGGDTGIDGLLYFKDYEGKFHRIIIEVKGGGYQPKDIKALGEVLRQEDEPMGVFLTLHPPTKGMRAVAAGMGTWTMPVSGRVYPKMQIFTIQDYYDGKRPDLPETGETLKKAKRELKEADKTKKLKM